MKIVLVSVHSHPSPQAIPLAAAFLKSCLVTDEQLSREVSVVLLDFFLDDSVADCAAAILNEAPDAVGFSIYVWNRDHCAAISREISNSAKPPVLFAGGPEPTADPTGVMATGSFGFVIRGEGETAFLAAVSRLRNRTVTDGGGRDAIAQEIGPVVEGVEPEFLDTLPSPYLCGVLDPSLYTGILWQLSRGCSFRCDFCFDNRGKRHIRRFSFDRIRAELELFVAKKVSQIFVLDSTFNHDPKLAKQLLRLIRKIAPHIHFHFEVRSEFIDREMARLFAEVNCSLQVGLQSSDPEVLKQVHRHFDPDDFSGKISMLNEQGAIFGFDLIYGLPGDSLAGFRRSLDYALSLYPNHLDIFPLALLPGTVLAGRAKTLGLDHQPHPPYTLKSSSSFPAADMEAAGRLACACDVFYSRGKAVAWFQAVIRPLCMSPSHFFEQFYDWLSAGSETPPAEAGYEDEQIWKMQRDFISYLYGLKKEHALLPVALDLIDYHYHYAAALMTPPPELPADSELESMDLLSACFVVPPSTRLAVFSYEILEILDTGDFDLREFTERFHRHGSQAAIYPRGGEVFTESLDSRYYRLLCHFTSPGTAACAIDGVGLTDEEARSFLEFAVAEGILECAAGC